MPRKRKVKTKKVKRKPARKAPIRGKGRVTNALKKGLKYGVYGVGALAGSQALLLGLLAGSNYLGGTYGSYGRSGPPISVMAPQLYSK